MSRVVCELEKDVGIVLLSRTWLAVLPCFLVDFRATLHMRETPAFHETIHESTTSTAAASFATCPASGPGLESLRLVEALVLLRILGETVHESRTQHFIFVRLDLGPGVVKDLLGAQAALRGLVEKLLEETSSLR